LTSGKPYDIFCFNNAGTPTLEVLVWTDDTTRATALAYQNGVLIKSGVPTRRYLGTLYTSGANTTEDSLAKRYLWNYYHKVSRRMRVIDTTDSWNYSVNTYRQARATATNQLDFIQGVAEELVYAEIAVSVQDSAAADICNVAIGLDSTTTRDSEGINAAASTLAIGNARMPVTASYTGLPVAGRHTLVWLERSQGAGTTTWYGDDGGTSMQSGISGYVRG
jgi:hypothetical protein